MKIKVILILIVSFILLLSSYFIANNYYNKPVFLALIAGVFYIISLGFLTAAEKVFFASNKFKYPFFKEIVFQVLRLILIPLVIFLTIDNISQEASLFVIISSLAIAYFISLLFMLVMMNRKAKFIHLKSEELTKKEKSELWKFVIPLSATVLSGVFFGYIDMVMLGRFVIAEYIGYYRAAFSLIGSLIPFIAFSNALFPIFSRLNGKQLDKSFKQTKLIIIIFSILGVLGTLIFADLAVNLIFGPEYAPAASILRILAVLLIIVPITMLYSSYFISQGKTKIVAKILIFATIMDIILNYIFITWFIHYSLLMAVMGAAIATIIGRMLYLSLLFINRK